MPPITNELARVKIKIMELIDFSKQHSVINQYIAEIRDCKIQGDRLRFRQNIMRIGQMMAYEISKRLSYNTISVEAPLGTAQCDVPCDPMVLCTILRAGLPFHEGFLNVFDKAENAFVSAYRKYTDQKHFNVHIEYLASPRIDDKTLIIADPMLATGSSMELAYQAMLTKGHPKKIHIASVIAAKPAIELMQKVMPEDTTIWCAAIDDALNAQSYIVPGLGDAGDLIYGEKE